MSKEGNSFEACEDAGILFIFTGPYGSGKTTLAKLIVAKIPSIKLFVTFTTRAPRSGEIHGVDYFFVSLEVFNERKEKGFFIEDIYLHGFFYGTPKHYCEALIRGESFLMVLNRDGALFWKKKYSQSKILWIDCLNDDIIKERIIKRSANNDNNQHILSDRLIKNKVDRMNELSSPISDYVLINSDQKKSFNYLNNIIQDLPVNHF